MGRATMAVWMGWKTGLASVCLALGLLSTPVTAQENPFAPAFSVNGKVVSNFELTQRIILFSLLDPKADATTEARKSLIDDKLRLGVAEAMEVTVSSDEVLAGMEEFAARANLSAEEFMKIVGQRGVQPETFRDFVSAGLVWRSVVQKRFQPEVKISDAMIDRAIAEGSGSGGEVKVLLSEIVLPQDGATDAMELALRIKGDVSSAEGFAAAARLYSKSPTGPRGGLLDWAALADLPAPLIAAVANLKPDEMSEPFAAEGAVRLYYLRDVSATGGDGKGVAMIDYLSLVLPAGSDVAALRAGVDRCEDLMPAARNLPEEAMLRQTLPESALPSEVAGLVAHLDAGETAAFTSANGQAGIVMLCARNPASVVAPSRDDVGLQLMNRQLGQRAAAYLDQLRFEALIQEN